MRPFSVFKRNSNGLYYVQFRDTVSGKRLAPRALGTRDPDEAFNRVTEWLRDGIPDGKGHRRSLSVAASIEGLLSEIRRAPLTEDDAVSIFRDLQRRGLLTADGRKVSGPVSEPFGAWLQAFWRFDSPYIRERLAHGQRATKRHCQDMESRAREIASFLPPGITLGEIRRQHLVDLGLAFKGVGLAPATINKNLSAATTALRWAAGNELIPSDPTRGLRGFSGVKRRRGILEAGEVKALFASTWEDERSRVACLTSATTGARLGEVLALQLQDIGEDRLYIRHSYSIRDGLKCTKTGEAREVPLLPAVRFALLALEAKSPHPATPARFIFAGKHPEKPLDANRILLGFRKALVSMNGKDWKDRAEVLPEYTARGIDFHSWRHWYTTQMSERLDARTVQKGTGHKTSIMLEHYADHATQEALEKLSGAAEEAFGNILPFSRTA